MSYVRDRKNNPIRINGSFKQIDKGFTIVTMGQWGDGMPDKDLFSQDDVNNYFASQLNNYALAPIDPPVITGFFQDSNIYSKMGLGLQVRGINFRGINKMTIGGIVVPNYAFNIQNSNILNIHGYMSPDFVGGTIVLTNTNGDSLPFGNVVVNVGQDQINAPIIPNINNIENNMPPPPPGMPTPNNIFPPDNMPPPPPDNMPPPPPDNMPPPPPDNMPPPPPGMPTPNNIFPPDNMPLPHPGMPN